MGLDALSKAAYSAPRAGTNFGLRLGYLAVHLTLDLALHVTLTRRPPPARSMGLSLIGMSAFGRTDAAVTRDNTKFEFAAAAMARRGMGNSPNERS